MLLEFKVENFKSFKEETSFTMEATVDKRHPQNLISEGKFNFLKTSMIYGANASGKTNLIDAMGLLRIFVLKSHSHVPELLLLQYPFIFDGISRSKPTRFQIKFLKNKTIYDYSFSYDANGITKESLTYSPNGRLSTIFKRNGQEFIFTKNKGEQKLISERVKKTSLYLSVSYQFNCNITKDAFEWFLNDFLVLVNNNVDTSLNALIHRMDSNTLFDARVKKAFKIADFGIVAIKDKSKAQKDVGGTIQGPFVPMFSFQDIWVDHNIIDKSGNSITIELPINQESSGTIRFISTIGPIIDALSKGSTLAVDELDVNFHPDLCKWIMSLFYSPEENPHGAQLIFNTHDVGLLNLDEIRRDQVWFVEKQWETGESHLVPLSEYKERNDRDIRNSYINGRYYAKPFISTERLME